MRAVILMLSPDDHDYYNSTYCMYAYVMHVYNYTVYYTIVYVIILFLCCHILYESCVIINLFILLLHETFLL